MHRAHRLRQLFLFLSFFHCRLSAHAFASAVCRFRDSNMPQTNSTVVELLLAGWLAAASPSFECSSCESHFLRQFACIMRIRCTLHVETTASDLDPYTYKYDQRHAEFIDVGRSVIRTNAKITNICVQTIIVGQTIPARKYMIIFPVFSSREIYLARMPC